MRAWRGLSHGKRTRTDIIRSASWPPWAALPPHATARPFLRRHALCRHCHTAGIAGIADRAVAVPVLFHAGSDEQLLAAALFLGLCRAAGFAGPSVASPIICRSALAMEAHRGVASLANTARYGQAMRLALRSDGCAQPTTSDP